MVYCLLSSRSGKKDGLEAFTEYATGKFVDGMFNQVSRITEKLVAKTAKKVTAATRNYSKVAAKSSRIINKNPYGTKATRAKEMLERAKINLDIAKKNNAAFASFQKTLKEGGLGDVLKEAAGNKAGDKMVSALTKIREKISSIKLKRQSGQQKPRRKKARVTAVF